jgi:hypothetical protein
MEANVTEKEFYDHCIDIAREVFPLIPQTDECKDVLGYLVWNHTAYPFFGACDEGFALCKKQLEDWRDGKVDEWGMPIDLNELPPSQYTGS